MLRSHTCGELSLANQGAEVTLCGWVQKSRDLGGLTFIDLRDRYGLTQLAFNMDFNADLCTAARKLGREFVIKANGIVKERESKNTKIPTGEIEIIVSSFEILNEAITPPFTIEEQTDGGDDLRIEISLSRFTTFECESQFRIAPSYGYRNKKLSGCSTIFRS